MISHLDHIVLTVANIDRAVSFYKSVLNMDVVTFADDRKAMKFGQQHIYFQLLGEEIRNHAMEGAGNICLVTDWQMNDVLDHLKQFDVPILEGPFNTMGVQGSMQSVYFNDPDNNLIQIGVYVDNLEEDKPDLSEDDLKQSEALFEGLSPSVSDDSMTEMLSTGEAVSEELSPEESITEESDAEQDKQPSQDDQPDTTATASKTSPTKTTRAKTTRSRKTRK